MSELHIKKGYIKGKKRKNWLESVLKICLNCFSSLIFHLISKQSAPVYSRGAGHFTLVSSSLNFGPLNASLF